MIIHGINDNKLIPHLSYLGVYQNEVKTRELYKEINIYLGLEPNPPKHWQKDAARLSAKNGN